MSETDAILRSSLFPYFGGKGRVADVVWAAFDTNVLLYVEPFFGSGAVLFARPHVPANAREIVNDADGLIVNTWRAIKHAPDVVASIAD